MISERECSSMDMEGQRESYGFTDSPPILFPFLLCINNFSPILFYFMFILYVIMLSVMGIIFALQRKDIKYIISVPIVYMIEHGSYTMGILERYYRFYW